ncbi:helix-turn-helix domain-containing protein [Streptococcus entericus]|uniref:helix-turn-helix domain-containing protein n=1 Tax=Streptococcus entericus TaxID=155680 RepID=UPI00037F953E|nr:helix-turn-helix domain-containing protein [Streptococcus entericus]
MNKTTGDLLREARTKKGLALQTIERSTGIATHNLLAIELDQFSLIDADKLEQYLRTYAEAVDLDFASLGFETTEEPVAEVASQVEQVEEPFKVSSFDELVKSEDPDYVPSPVTSTTLRRSGRNSHSQKSSSGKGNRFLGPILTLLGLATLIFAGFMLYKNYLADFLTAKTNTANETVASVSTTPSSSEVSTTPSESTPPAPATQLAVTGGGEAITVAVTTAQKPIKVELSLSGAERSWVALSNSDIAGGVTLSSEQPTYTATLTEGATQAVLEMGITEGVTIKVNGQELDKTALTSTAYSIVTFNIQ